MKYNPYADFFQGLLGAWALAFVLALISSVVPLSFLGLPITILVFGVPLVLAVRARRPYIAWGMLTAIVLPALVMGACLAIFSMPGR